MSVIPTKGSLLAGKKTVDDNHIIPLWPTLQIILWQSYDLFTAYWVVGPVATVMDLKTIVRIRGFLNLVTDQHFICLRHKIWSRIQDAIQVRRPYIDLMLLRCWLKRKGRHAVRPDPADLIADPNSYSAGLYLVVNCFAAQTSKTGQGCIQLLSPDFDSVWRVRNKSDIPWNSIGSCLLWQQLR